MSNVIKRFPSYEILIKGIVSTFVRFPFVLTSALLGSAVAIRLVGIRSERYLQQPDLEIKLLVVFSLGIPLFFALATLAEKRKWSKFVGFAAQGVGAFALLAYFISLPAGAGDLLVVGVRHALLNIGLHFLVSFLPFTGEGESSGFWQYNKTLFLRILTSALYSLTLYLGLTVALLAADYLFGVDVEPLRYFQLWIIIAGVFNTWFFLAGVPADLNSLGGVKDYPAGLKTFAQNVLLPLVGLYFFILFAYEIKVIATANWPKGWVSQLVLWYSALGILSLLLLHPLKSQTRNRWIQVFSKWFFRALVPLIGMLLTAIFWRIGDYGFTENRYFVLAMALGLTLVVLYFMISKDKDIRIIPITIFALVVVSSYGPWSAFSVSLRSQSDRLEGALLSNNLLVSGETPENVTVSFESGAKMSSIVRYLYESRGLDPFLRWIPDSSLAELDSDTLRHLEGKLAALLGFEYTTSLYLAGDSSAAESSRRFSMYVNEEDVVLISDYQYYIPWSSDDKNDTTFSYPLTDDSLFVQFDKHDRELRLYVSNSIGDSTSALTFDFREALKDLAIEEGQGAQDSPELAERTFELSGEGFDVRLVVTSLQGWKSDSGFSVDRLALHIFLKKR